MGFRTPEQAFETFRTAVRADDPSLLRRCFSADFIARNRLSEQVFRTFWERLQKDEPFLRKGVADAEPSGKAEIARTQARIRAESHGRKLVVDLVLEDFCEAFSGGEKVADEAAPFRERTGIQAADDGARWIYGRMPLPAGTAPERVTELRFGREWKIDDFRLEENTPGQAGADRDTLGAGDAVP